MNNSTKKEKTRDDHIIRKEYATRLGHYFRTFAASTIARWLVEAQGDIVTLCVLYGYQALILLVNVQVETLTGHEMASCIGALAYVRNWHGFGQHLVTSQENSSQNSSLSPEDRMKRWLQSRGVDTSSLTLEYIQKLLSQAKTRRRGGMFLTIGHGEAPVQAPAFFNHHQVGCFVISTMHVVRE